MKMSRIKIIFKENCSFYDCQHFLKRRGLSFLMPVDSNFAIIFIPFGAEGRFISTWPDQLFVEGILRY